MQHRYSAGRDRNSTIDIVILALFATYSSGAVLQSIYIVKISSILDDTDTHDFFFSSSTYNCTVISLPLRLRFSKACAQFTS